MKITQRFTLEQIEIIKKMAKAGAMFSKQCRDIWTHEQIATTLRKDDFCGCTNHLFLIVSRTDLLDYGRLDEVFYMGRPDQSQWDEKKWITEIKKRIIIH